MMAYLFINLCVVSVPLALSFEKRVKYYRKFPALFSAILSVGAIYILWDIFASARGDWSFNERYILGGRFLGVPLEEVLFFIVVPYSCLFIYEVCLYFFKDHQVRISSINFIFLALVFGLLACFNRERGYTFAVLVFCSLSFFLTLLIAPGILRSRVFWLFILISYGPFLLTNYFLTSLPVVVYNPAGIWGGRFLTIPYEDFLYSFSLMLSSCAAYSFFKARILKS